METRSGYVRLIIELIILSGLFLLYGLAFGNNEAWAGVGSSVYEVKDLTVYNSAPASLWISWGCSGYPVDYAVYLNGQVVQEVPGTSYEFTGLQPITSYTVSVAAPGAAPVSVSASTPASYAPVTLAGAIQAGFNQENNVLVYLGAVLVIGGVFVLLRHFVELYGDDIKRRFMRRHE